MRTALMIIFLFISATFGIAYLGLTDDGTVQPEQEQINRDTFEHSHAHISSTIHELRDLQTRFDAASPEHKIAIAALIISDANEISADNLPDDLRAFVAGIRTVQ